MVPRDTALHIIASHRDLDGKPLPVAHAAVELINLLRPTVAVERCVTFAALALHKHPESRARLLGGDEPEYLDWFVQEVRRFYPFLPLVAGRARMAFEWRGHRFGKGTWMCWISTAPTMTREAGSGRRHSGRSVSVTAT